uniref:Regulatory protein C.BcnI n=1 Tax=Brevibacillus centrosporus TaxID=54910 RepID=Q8RNV9_9BACL|nr:regulatory protein C.BcnI [Brevibacillus centrosporus]
MGDICRKFGRKVRIIREQKGLTQEKLAEEAGLHRTYISSLERGERSISLNNIEKIARALDVEIYQLFIFREEKS